MESLYNTCDATGYMHKKPTKMMKLTKRENSICELFYMFLQNQRHYRILYVFGRIKGLKSFKKTFPQYLYHC